MLLLVGLGNPGSQYARNRHNAGFVAADAIHRRHRFSPWRRRFHAEVSEGRFGDTKCLLLKPQTYMNDSGRAVGEAVRFYKIGPEQVVVIHDEADLAPGKMRMKAGGGSAGHNGVKSVSATIGEAFRRLRIGVGHPGHREAVPHYVLHDFAKTDRSWLDPMIDAIAEYAPLLAEDRDSTFANRLHEALDQHSSPAKKPGNGKASKGKVESDSAEPETPVKAAGTLARRLRKLFGG